MSDIAAYSGAAVLMALAAWAFAIERRGGRHPIRWAALAFALSEGISLALLAPGTVALSQAGVNGLSVIAIGDTARTVALSFLMVEACLLNQRRPRRLSAPVQVAVAVSTQAAMVLLFIAARPTLDSGGSLIAGRSGRWPLALRVALFAGYAVWALVELFLALLPQARTAPTGPLRWAVRLLQAAICLGVVWSLWSYDDFVRVSRYGVLDGSEDTVSNTLGAACAALMVTAALVGKWSVTLEAATRWVRLCRCYVVMGPLWSALRQAMPEIAFPQGGRPLLTLRPAGIEFAVYRRVIEIHDGRLVLRAYHHPRVAALLAEAGPSALDAGRPADGSGHCAGEPAPADPALVEAATIATALENLRLGRRFTDTGGTAAPDAGFVPADLDAEVRWLSRVALAFRRSPAIPALLERLREEEG
jgi:hypothetical protein